MIARDVELAALTGAHLHVCHVSTKGALHIIEEAKSSGAHVTCEVTSHHLTLTDEVVGTYDTDTKVNPPPFVQRTMSRPWCVPYLKDSLTALPRITRLIM